MTIRLMERLPRSFARRKISSIYLNIKNDNAPQFGSYVVSTVSPGSTSTNEDKTRDPKGATRIRITI